MEQLYSKVGKTTWWDQLLAMTELPIPSLSEKGARITKTGKWTLDSSSFLRWWGRGTLGQTWWLLAVCFNLAVLQFTTSTAWKENMQPGPCHVWSNRPLAVIASLRLQTSFYFSIVIWKIKHSQCNPHNAAVKNSMSIYLGIWVEESRFGMV